MNNCLVIALLSLVPAKNIRLREIERFFAKRLMKRLVSQFVRVMLAAVKRPFGSRLIFVAISSTRKSCTLAFRIPPMPGESTAKPVSPIASAVSAVVVTVTSLTG